VFHDCMHAFVLMQGMPMLRLSALWFCLAISRGAQEVP
jgi:hypothetical protein